MRVDYALIFTVFAMVVLVLLGQPALALLAGLAGILFIGASGDSYRKFEDVGVPEPGEYPKWDFWKEVLEKSGEFFGKQAKTFLRTEQLVDQWSSWLKKGIWKAKGGSIHMFGPFATNIPEDYLKIGGATALLQQAEMLAKLKETDPELYKKVMELYQKKLESMLKGDED